MFYSGNKNNTNTFKIKKIYIYIEVGVIVLWVSCSYMPLLLKFGNRMLILQILFKLQTLYVFVPAIWPRKITKKYNSEKSH